MSLDQEAKAWKVKNMWNVTCNIMGSRSFQHTASSCDARGFARR